MQVTESMCTGSGLVLRASHVFKSLEPELVFLQIPGVALGKSLSLSGPRFPKPQKEESCSR